jgi:hypothetical protein
MAYLDPDKLKPLLKRGDPRHRFGHGKLKEQRVLCRELADYLRVHVADVSKLARKMQVLRVVWNATGNRQLWVTWPGAERIIMLVRARQGQREIDRLERAHFRRPSESRG